MPPKRQTDSPPKRRLILVPFDTYKALAHKAVEDDLHIVEEADELLRLGLKAKGVVL